LVQPYKHYYAEAIDGATRTGCTNFNKPEFLASLSSIRQKTLTQPDIHSSFKKAGFIPFESALVLNKMRETMRK
jgi:hypothetical protein